MQFNCSEALTDTARKLIALLLVHALAPALPSAPLPSLGVITSARAAQIGDAQASAGTTLYPGDRLTTNRGGWLRVSAANFQLQLQESTLAVLNEFSAAEYTGRNVELASGSIDISLSSAMPFRVLARGAVFRPTGNRPTLAHIDVRSTREVHISIRRGQMELVYQNQTAILYESNSYAVLLNPTDKEIAFATDRSTPKPEPRHVLRKPLFLLILLASAAAIAIPLLTHSYESPHTP